jgi:gliotoxin/aspirochlorine biosynthesis aminotransferase
VVGISVVAENLEDCLSSKALVPALEAAFDRAHQPVKALLLTNPHNPLAQCYPRTCIEECIKFCARRNIHYISDEVYGMTSFSLPGQEELSPFVSALSIDTRSLGCDPSRVHVVWSPSKDFGQSGTRMVC